MRIVTRPDFDGIVCAALLTEVEPITHPTKWVQPNDMQKGLIAIKTIDIIANLPYAPDCALWFDHHVTNEIKTEFNGAFRVAPSAARIVFEYYEGRFKRDYSELINNTDDIDSANLNADQILRPENYPYILLSMTIWGRVEEDTGYWNHLVELLRHHNVDQIMLDPDVSERCRITVSQNNAFHGHLIKHTRLDGAVAVTDFRSMHPAPEGNRFLAYSLFPDANASVKIRYQDDNRQNVVISVGHSIINQTCRVNIGKMLSKFGGGGHQGAGACTISTETAEDVIQQIVTRLQNNK